MKKSLRSLLAFLIAATVLCCIAMADTGPKPSASFTFTGMPDEDYYVTMLSQVERYGPHCVYQEGEEIPGYVLEQGEDDPAYPAWRKFVDYRDPDGYYFLADLFEQCHGDDEAAWRYYPPERFKLLLYFPESDTLLCSTVTERYAFDSVYRLDLGGKSPTEVAALTLTDPNGDPLPTGTVTLDKADGTRQQLIGFFGRLGITLVIELALAWVWKYRKGSQLLFIAVANLVTQCLLNAALLYWGAQETSRGAIIFWYILLELAVTGIEAAAYAYLLPGTDHKEEAVRRHAALYALSANLLSFLGGLALSEVFP
uniref:hypothetical protein n=1 Tax=Angelakisella sp. TaxID=1935177 RepID=UPI004029AE6C